MTDLQLLLFKLRGLDEKLAAGPWNEDALQAGLRHLMRNDQEVLNEVIEADNSDNKATETPSMYDGRWLAMLRNLLPEAIKTLEQASNTAPL